MSKLTKPLPIPKPIGIAIRAVLIAVAAVALVWLILFIHAMTFTTDYVNATSRHKDLGLEHDAFLNESSYEINLPFFGNSVLLDGTISGMVYTMPSYLGELGEYGLSYLIGAYDNINNVLDAYTWMIAVKYDGRAKVNYSVEKSDGLLTVHFDGAGYNEDGSLAENIDKKFIFNVKGASAFNFPEWINRAPEDDYFADLEFLTS